MIWRLVLAACLAWSLVAFGSIKRLRAQFNGCPAGFCAPVTSGGGSALSLDGAIQNSAAGNVTLALTTTKGSGQIVVLAGTNAVSFTSVTATGLTFNVRKAYAPTFGFAGIAEYVANYTTNFSGVITVNIPTATTTTAAAFGIAGANTTAGVSAPPYDANGSLPAFSISTTASGTTSNATDFVFGILSLSNSTDTANGAWTTLPTSGSNFMLVEYQIVSSAGTYTLSTTGGFGNGSILDAIVH